MSQEQDLNYNQVLVASTISYSVYVIIVTGITRTYIKTTLDPERVAFGTGFFVSPRVLFFNDHGQGAHNPTSYFMSAPPYNGMMLLGATNFERNEVLPPCHQ